MPKKLGKKSLSELGNETRHGKRLKGICAMQSDLKEVHGINLAALPRGDGSRRAALTTPGLATSLVVERTTNTPLPRHQQRAACVTGRAPLPPPNVQARPYEKVWRFINRVAVSVPLAEPGIRRPRGAVAVAVEAPGQPILREMEDWSAEYAILQLKKAGGRVHLINPGGEEPPGEAAAAEAAMAAAAAMPVEATATLQRLASSPVSSASKVSAKPSAKPIKLTSVHLAPCGAPEGQRVKEVDLIHIYSLPMSKVRSS